MDAMPQAPQDNPQPDAATVAETPAAAELAAGDAGQSASPQDDAHAFEQGFAGVTGEALDEPQPPTQEELDAELVERLGLTGVRERLEELDKLKERDAKVFGHLGNLKQQLEEFRTRLPQGAPQSAFEVTDEDFAELQTDYPDLAAAMKNVLNRAFSRGVPPADAGVPEQPGAVSPAAPPAVSRTSDAVAMAQDELTVRHEDWREVAASPEFQAWKATLSPARREIAEGSWSVQAVSTLLDEFKAHQAQAQQQKQARQSRLEAAVTPRGRTQATPAQTQEDAFRAGFERVMHPK